MYGKFLTVNIQIKFQIPFHIIDLLISFQSVSRRKLNRSLACLLVLLVIFSILDRYLNKLYIMLAEKNLLVLEAVDLILFVVFK